MTDPLVRHGLKYGRLMEIRSKAARARYNRALQHLTGKATKLRSFHIDLSGFSPEVAAELKDPRYLNPNGVNKKFILLSTGQARLPALDTMFTSSATILRKFITDNHRPLFALSTRDVIFGELDNSTFRIDGLDDLLSIRKVKVEVRTLRDIIAKARELKRAIRAFNKDDGAWHDDDAMRKIVELAEVTGDIRRHPVVPTTTTYQKPSYYSGHFGGVYVFLDTAPVTVISVAEDFESHLEGFAGKVSHIPLADQGAVAQFLLDRRLIEYYGDGRLSDPVGLLREKADIAAYGGLAAAGAVKSGAGALPEGEALKRLIYDNLDALPRAFQSLTNAVKAMESDREVALTKLPADIFFYAVRAANHGDRDLVNHLLARLTPADFRQAYICNQPLFYAQYKGWPAAQKSVAARYLAAHYAGREAEVEDRLYGWDMGPWGARAS